MKLAINSYPRHFPDFWSISWHFLIDAKFPDISRFSRQATSNLAVSWSISQSTSRSVGQTLVTRLQSTQRPQTHQQPSCEQSDLVPSCTSSFGFPRAPASSARTGRSCPATHTHTHVDTQINTKRPSLAAVSKMHRFMAEFVY